MKKLILVAVCLISIFGGVYTSELPSGNEMDELMVENVEALSQDENGKGCKLHLTSICETSHSDHYLYRNR